MTGTWITLGENLSVEGGFIYRYVEMKFHVDH